MVVHVRSVTGQPHVDTLQTHPDLMPCQRASTSSRYVKHITATRKHDKKPQINRLRIKEITKAKQQGSSHQPGIVV